jgi:hypothetical protein
LVWVERGYCGSGELLGAVGGEQGNELPAFVIKLVIGACVEHVNGEGKCVER